MSSRVFRTLLFLIAICASCTAQIISEQKINYSISEIDSIIKTLPDEVGVNTDQVNALLESSYELKYSKGIILCHNLLGEHYYHKDSLELGQFHFEKQYTEAQRIGDRYEEGMALGQLASILLLQEKLVDAVEKSRQALTIAEELNDSTLICNEYLTLSEIYNTVLDYDVELDYLFLALQYHTDDNSGISRGYLYTMMGSIYFTINDNENSLKYFNLAEISFKEMDASVIHDEAYFNLYFGEFLLEIDSSSVAVDYCDKAKTYFSNIGSKQATVDCLACLLDGYNKLNERSKVERLTDSLEILVQQYSNPYIKYVLHNAQYKNYDFTNDQVSIVSKYVNSFEDLLINENKFKIYQTEKQIELKVIENKLLIKQSNLERKQLERNLSLSLAILILLALIFLLSHFLTKRKLMRKSIIILKLNEKQKSIELENELRQKESLAQKLDYSERGVTIKATLIREFNSKLEDIKIDLSKVNFVNQPDDRKIIQNVIRRLDTELESEDSFIDFLDHFNTLYPQFFERIQERFPKLNIHDKKLCAYIKMNLESKEVADLLHVIKSSVNTARYRLRKKLGLPKSEDLNQFIQNI